MIPGLSTNSRIRHVQSHVKFLANDTKTWAYHKHIIMASHNVFIIAAELWFRDLHSLKQASAHTCLEFRRPCRYTMQLWAKRHCPFFEDHFFTTSQALCRTARFSQIFHIISRQPPIDNNCACRFCVLMSFAAFSSRTPHLYVERALTLRVLRRLFSYVIRPHEPRFLIPRARCRHVFVYAHIFCVFVFFDARYISSVKRAQLNRIVWLISLFLRLWCWTSFSSVVHIQVPCLPALAVQ